MGLKPVGQHFLARSSRQVVLSFLRLNVRTGHDPLHVTDVLQGLGLGLACAARGQSELSYASALRHAEKQNHLAFQVTLRTCDLGAGCHQSLLCN